MVEDYEPAPLDPRAPDWPAAEPPSGFAERAVDVFLEEAARPIASRSRRRLALLGAVVGLAAALLLWVAFRGRAMSDSVDAQARVTVVMHDRAIAVAEAGTQLRWSVDADGNARVEQTRGSVFYRVESGPAFEVQTAAGTVSVTGTCFEVRTLGNPMSNQDSNPMSRSSGMKAAALGAALASAVVVTVYEGGVVLANDAGQVALAAGERGVAQAGAAPHRDDRGDDGRDDSADDGGSGSNKVARPGADDAVAHARRQARALESAAEDQRAKEAEIERLRKQVMELGGTPGKASPKELKVRAQQCASQGRGGDCPFLEPDEETLREMARCAAVKVDFPGFLDNIDSPEVSGLARTLGIDDPAEVAGLQAAADKHYAEFNSALQDIFVQLGGDADMAQDASAATMKSYIADQLDRELRDEVQRRVAQERAGLREPPADLSALSIEERAFRMHAELGNRFEEHLAAQLGPDRARELRRARDGWPGSTSVNSGDCIDSP